MRADFGEDIAHRLREHVHELVEERFVEAERAPIPHRAVEPRSVENHEQLGLALALSGKFDEAVTAFEEAVRLDGRDVSARLNLAVSLAEIGRTDEARQHAEEALRIDPSYDKARQFLAAMAQKR